MTNREILAAEGYEDAIVFENPDYDEAIIGVTDEGQVVYEFNLMIKHLMDKDGMSRDEAIEFIEYNTIRALQYNMAEVCPIIINSIKGMKELYGEADNEDL